MFSGQETGDGIGGNDELLVPVSVSKAPILGAVSLVIVAFLKNTTMEYSPESVCVCVCDKSKRN